MKLSAKLDLVLLTFNGFLEDHFKTLIEVEALIGTRIKLHELSKLFDKLIEEKYIEEIFEEHLNQQTFTKNGVIKYHISHKGILFLEKGGYRGTASRHWWGRFGRRTGIVLSALNAFALVIIAFLGVYYNHQNDIRDKRIFDLDRDLKECKSSITPLQIKSSTSSDSLSKNYPP